MKRRSSTPAVTEIRSTSTVFGSARSRVALSSLPTPIALAKSSPVPAGNTANVAPVPANPFSDQVHAAVAAEDGDDATVFPGRARERPHLLGRARHPDLVVDTDLVQDRR